MQISCTNEIKLIVIFLLNEYSKFLYFLLLKVRHHLQSLSIFSKKNSYYLRFKSLPYEFYTTRLELYYRTYMTLHKVLFHLNILGRIAQGSHGKYNYNRCSKSLM